MAYGLQTPVETILPPPGVVEYDSNSDSILLSDGRRMSRMVWDEMTFKSRNYVPMRLNGGGNGRIMHSSSYQPYISSYDPYYGGPSAFCVPTSYYPTNRHLEASSRLRSAEDIKEEKELEKRIEREQRLEKQRQSLSNMPDWRKKIVRKAIKALLFEQEVNEIMSGLKWFLIFLGLAILFNFGKILDVIKLFVLQP